MHEEVENPPVRETVISRVSKVRTNFPETNERIIPAELDVEEILAEVLHHSIFKQFTGQEPNDIPGETKQEITIRSEQAELENELQIREILPTELQDYKDVFQFPKGLPPSRGIWDFKLTVDKSKIKDLRYQEPIIMDKAAKQATKEMLDQYLKDGWISPSSTHYAVNMFPVPKKVKIALDL